MLTYLSSIYINSPAFSRPLLRRKPRPHSHSIVRIEPNELICRCKKLLRLESSRRPNRQMRMAFEFKEEFDRPENLRFQRLSIAGDLPGVSRAIWTAPREVARTRRACGIQTL